MPTIHTVVSCASQCYRLMLDSLLGSPLQSCGQMLVCLGLIILDEKMRGLRKRVGGGKEFLGALIRKGLDLFKKKNENRLRSIF